MHNIINCFGRNNGSTLEGTSVVFTNNPVFGGKKNPKSSVII